jgi:GNAT superfamily N-acetyltransferase
MPLSIEAAQPRDAAVLLALIRALAEYEKLTHLVVGTEQQLREELFGARPVIEAVVGWEDGRAVGFALYFHNFSTFLARRGLYLEDLFVVPEARGRGYGKALMRHVARIAVERECGRFEWAVLDWNQPAIAFYRSLGAEVLPDWRICRLTGEALMALGSGS